ncbi:MAG: family 10 glycosylhydrolase [Candidatus Sumerlaeia bacterium]|nr:family 10 glycosylhydrolase [Candidatus Sumerlaeia bacterium]
MEDPFAAPFDDPFAAPDDSAVPEDPFAAPDSPFDDPFGETPDDPFAPRTEERATPTPTPTATPLPRVAIPRVSVQEGRFDIRGIYVTSTGAGIQDTGQVLRLARDVQAARFNRVYVEVRTTAGVAYPSQIEPSLGFINRAFPSPVQLLRDELGDGVEIIAVVDLLAVYNSASGSRPPEGNPAGRFPEYVNQSVDGRSIAPDNLVYLDPGNPEARRYLSGVIFEIMRTIRPDGILFRNAHYPNNTFGYSDEAVKIFRETVGGSGPPQPDDRTWSAWRRAQLTELFREMREAIDLVDPAASMGVLVPGAERPPTSWNDYLSTADYSQLMMDWIRWSREGVVNEVTIRYHYRNVPQDDGLRRWVDFLNSNVGNARPVMYFSGQRNTSQGLRHMFDRARAFGVGTLLHHYSDPARDYSPGFFPSVPNVLYRGRFGNPLARRALTGTEESREFSRMSSPPPTYRVEVADANLPFNWQEDSSPDISSLRFTSPTPVPTPTPAQAMRPEQILREITLTSGRSFEAVVIEFSPTQLTLQPPDGVPLTLSRQVIRNIEPPLNGR